VARSRDSGVYQRSAPSAFLREEITNGENENGENENGEKEIGKSE
jgi:hypothetical protein